MLATASIPTFENQRDCKTTYIDLRRILLLAELACYLLSLSSVFQQLGDWATMAQQIADLVIDATSTETPNVYALSRSRWFSGIADEQTAAFNLVWALADRRRLEDGTRAAVVGGGPAAMSAAVALLAYNCVVDLYCPSLELMSIQRHAVHRFEHPTLMSWPQRELSFTTHLPMLDWYAAPISKVASVLIEQFNALLPLTANIFVGSDVISIAEIGSGMVRLITTPVNRDPAAYDCVILTEDFTGEPGVPGVKTPSYWQPDNLEADRDRRSSLTYMVSGTGIGGLTDALRLLHAELGSGEFLSNVAEELSETWFVRRILDFEDRQGGTHKLEAMASDYASLVQDMPSGIRDRLDQSLERGAAVLLAGREAVPFQAFTPPILKLFVTHALGRGRLRYEVGAPSVDGNQLQLNKSRYDLADTRLITRHGFASTLRSLPGVDEYAQIQQRGETINLSKPFWTSPYPSPNPKFPVHDFGNGMFRRYRFALAKEAISFRYPNAVLHIDEAGYVADFDVVPEHPPKQLFGIPLLFQGTSEASHEVALSAKTPSQHEETKAKAERIRDTDFISDDAELEGDELSRSIIAISLARHLHRIWQRNNDAPAASAVQENPTAAFVVHLDAPWGGGKTTFANYLAKVLNPIPSGRKPAKFLRERYPDLDVGGIFLGDPPTSPDEKNRMFSLPESVRRPWIVVNFNAWENEHCSPPWWIFFQTIRRQCFRSIRKEGMHPWCNNEKRDSLDLARRYLTFVGLQMREIWWRLLNPKILMLLGTAALSLTMLTLFYHFKIWGTTVVKDKTEIGFLVSSGFGLLLLGLSSGTAIWGAAALLTESVVPGTDTLAERLSIGKGDPFGRFRRHFNRTMHRLKRPVMVVVDDLDRCRPEFVVDLVRGMQTLLRSPRVVFVILGDRDWIERAFEGHHKTMSELDVGPEQRLGARFVEKAIQLSFVLPSIEGKSQANFVRQILLGARGGQSANRPPLEPELSSQLRQIVNSRFAADPSSVDVPETIVTAVMDELQRIEPTRTQNDVSADRGQIEEIVFNTLATSASSDERFEKTIIHQLESLAPSFPPNPRQIKRIVNAITIYASVMLQQRLGSDTQENLRFQLAIWIIIMTEWPRSWRTIVACPEIVKCIASDKPLESLSKISDTTLPGSREDVIAELNRMLNDPKLKSLIAGDKTLGNASLSVESVRILSQLTPLHSRGIRLTRQTQKQGEEVTDRRT